MMSRTNICGLSALFLLLAGCGSTDTSGGKQNASTGAGGGTSTPDKVKMNGTCPTNSGFVGDDSCLAPPDPSEGFQLHYGPSDYDDPTEVAKFTLTPGQETNDCFFVKTPNDADIVYSGYEIQMRPGSHHLNANARTDLAADGFGPCVGSDANPGGLLADSQTPKLDLRTDPAPENQGLGRTVPAHTQAVLNFHVINTTAKDTLREAWLNYYYIKPEDLKGQRGAVNLTGGLGYDITPGTHKTYQYSCSPSMPVRILALSTHMHAHALRMSMWKVSNKVKTKLMEGYSWEDPPTLFFDTAHTNTPANPTTATPGGDVSGDVTIDPTEALQWECEVNNDSNVTLTFRNEVFTGEMCLVTGNGVRADDPTQLGDFTCSRN